MGGSGSNRSYPSTGPGGGRADTDECDLYFETVLYGPVAGVVSKLKINNRLDVRLSGGNNSVGVYSGAQEAGTITGVAQLPELVKCLQMEVKYCATVKMLSGSTVRVAVRRAKDT